MDNQDRDFEAFLRRFQLRRTAVPFPQETPAQSVPAARRTYRLFLTAAAALVAALLSVSLIRNSMQTPAAEKIAKDEVIRADGDEVYAFNLPDGSRVEMRPRSELTLQSADDGPRIVLSDGGILVTAAAQLPGRLQIETHDTIVSATGAVFLVETQKSGTRVGVIEGEAEVRQGADVRRLGRGEQTSTDSTLQSQPLTEAIAWSSSGSSLPPIDAESRRKETESPLKRVVIVPPSVEHQEKSPPAPAPQAPAPPAPPRSLIVPPQAESKDQPPPDSGTEGPGKEILARECGSCHPLQVVESKRYDSRDAYATLVQRQVAMGAAVGQAEIPVLVDYLWRKYGLRYK